MSGPSSSSSKPSESGYGLVSKVSSGDTLSVWRCAVINGKMTVTLPPFERELTLASCVAPRLSMPKRAGASSSAPVEEEAFAWQSREHLRALCVGKLVKFDVEHKHPTTGRSYSHVFLNDGPVPTHVGVSQARAGWVRVRRPTNLKALLPAESHQAQLIAANVEAEEALVGVFQDPIHADAVRKIPQGFDSFQLFSRLHKSPQQFVVEQVRDATCIRGYLLPSMHYLPIRIAGAQAPIQPFSKDKQELPAEPHFAEAKYFTDSHILSRQVTLTFTSVDKQDATYFASVSLNGHDLGLELLRFGCARYVEWSTPRAQQAAYMAAESEAKSRRLSMWKDFSPVVPSGAASSSTSSSPSSSPLPQRDFQGVVREVRGNGELVIRKQDDRALVQITLSSIILPKYGRTRDLDEPYGYEAHEYLRSQLRGKTVKARFDYHRPANVERQIPEKACFTVFVN